ncbi:MAG: ATP-binding cassette domain-containing protein, partial [Arthrobacter sp.]
KDNRLPHELSGGEQQRVAIARAIVNRPGILLADEPTGNLDPTTSLGIMKVLDRINQNGTTVVMATHDHDIVNAMRKRVIELRNGKVVRDEREGIYLATAMQPVVPAAGTAAAGNEVPDAAVAPAAGTAAPAAGTSAPEGTAFPAGTAPAAAGGAGTGGTPEAPGTAKQNSSAGTEASE